MIQLCKLGIDIGVTEKQIKAMLGAKYPVCQTIRAIVKIPRDPANRRFEKVGELLHIDTWGPYSVEAWDQTKYFLFVTDDTTRFTWAVRLQRKDDTVNQLRILIHSIERQHDTKVKSLRIDNKFRQSSLLE